MLIMLGQKKKASPEIGNAFYFLIMSIEFSILNFQFFTERLRRWGKHLHKYHTLCTARGQLNTSRLQR